MTASLRLGFDIGGVFTDFVLCDPATGAVRLHKCLTTPDDSAIGALSGLHRLLSQAGASLSDVAAIVHGTTLVTNAIIERRGASLGLIATAGFRDVLEPARLSRACARTAGGPHRGRRAAGPWPNQQDVPLSLITHGEGERSPSPH